MDPPVAEPLWNDPYGNAPTETSRMKSLHKIMFR